MNTPTPGLRPIWNKSNSPQRVEIIVPVGDELHVSDYVADQFGTSFAPVEAKTTRKKTSSDEAETSAAPAAARKPRTRTRKTAKS